jgi:hypothetical protein
MLRTDGNGGEPAGDLDGPWEAVAEESSLHAAGIDVSGVHGTVDIGSRRVESGRLKAGRASFDLTASLDLTGLRDGGSVDVVIVGRASLLFLKRDVRIAATATWDGDRLRLAGRRGADEVTLVFRRAPR